MLKRKSLFKVTFIGYSVFMALTAGCSSEPTKGDKMGAFGQQMADLGKQWNQGKQTIADGEALKQKGEQMIKDGKANISKGDDMIEQGEQMVRESDRLFKERGGVLPTN